MAKLFKELLDFNVQTRSYEKYKIGFNSDKFETIKYLKPVFAFDYLCDDNSDYSFTGELLGAPDYRKLMKNLKRLSANTYEILSKEKQFHFHDIRWQDVSAKETDFNKCIYGTRENKGDLTPYQIKVYEEARLIGFLYKGVFYMVMFDRKHRAYKRK